MENDYYTGMNRVGVSPYEPQPQIPMYRTIPHSSSSSSSSSSSPSSLYPKIGQSGHSGIPPPARAAPYNHSSAPPPPSSSGSGIRVQIKPEYRITPPPQLLPQMGDIPRSSFQFDFDLEKKIIAESEKTNQNWTRFAAENLQSSFSEPIPPPMPSVSPAVDPIVRKYITSGLNREAVPLAVENYGDNPVKVKEFANAFTQLREMGFSSNAVGEALLMYDNDTDRALAHFLNSSS